MARGRIERRGGRPLFDETELAFSLSWHNMCPRVKVLGFAHSARLVSSLLDLAESSTDHIFIAFAGSIFSLRVHKKKKTLTGDLYFIIHYQELHDKEKQIFNLSSI